MGILGEITRVLLIQGTVSHILVDALFLKTKVRNNCLKLPVKAFSKGCFMVYKLYS